jgi:uncharacterized damage-inducible protein DinB
MALPLQEKTVNRTEQLCLMARYNQWMNLRLYSAAMTLPDADISAERQAFFGSILGTLNHLLAGDRVWLKRFAQHPAEHSALAPLDDVATPGDLRTLLCSDIRELWQQRQWQDQLILDWAASLSEADLDHDLEYRNMQGLAGARNFYSLLLHFFNHQTHHRGQATTLLTQAGVDVGDTDLLALIPSSL